MGRGADKPYIAQGEWSNSHGDEGLPFGGRKTNIQGKKDTLEKLPFDCCALSLTRFTSPVCTGDGHVFDMENISSFIRENHKHPFTGEPLELSDLTRLHYHKNTNGDYIDPVSFKQFTEFTKIVANRKSGNVYSWSSVDEFNIRAKNWHDLVTGEPFLQADLVILQDPAISKGRKEEPAREKSRAAEGAISKREQAAAATLTKKKAAQAHNAAKYSKGLAAASLTSTAFAPMTKNESEVIGEEEYMFARIKAKGYARVATNFGDLNLELYCDKAPRTCYNFIRLALSGYYRGTKFHRSIKNFMIQGGDPTGTGRGGKSFWGSDFKDEIGKKYSHSARGVLSMANRGPNTNSSQFFILYRAATHLDGKHTIFGRVVGGMPVLSKMEAVPTDDSDCPEADIVIKDIRVFVDPYDEFTKRLERKLEHQRDSEDLAAGKRQRTEAEEEQHERDTTTWFGTKLPSKTSLSTAGNSSGSSTSGISSSTGVGRYLKCPSFAAAKNPSQTNTNAQTSKKAARGYAFGDFSGW
ncbi:cyclophilin peptidyl-prolyl cis-trans isomerase Cyp8 [Dipsacomyces acuminosporus]|nr:cyclophilin peptidyl-prolyl cis-trans isomerase Cyp8 [Dipsacomyces acuminosporus]